MKWIKFSDKWPEFTFDDIVVRSQQIGERKVKFQSAMYPFSFADAKRAMQYGFFFSDCVHPMQNANVPMLDLEWRKD